MKMYLYATSVGNGLVQFDGSITVGSAVAFTAHNALNKRSLILLAHLVIDVNDINSHLGPNYF